MQGSYKVQNFNQHIEESLSSFERFLFFNWRRCSKAKSKAAARGKHFSSATVITVHLDPISEELPRCIDVAQRLSQRNHLSSVHRDSMANIMMVLRWIYILLNLVPIHTSTLIPSFQHRGKSRNSLSTPRAVSKLEHSGFSKCIKFDQSYTITRMETTYGIGGMIVTARGYS